MIIQRLVVVALALLTGLALCVSYQPPASAQQPPPNSSAALDTVDEVAADPSADQAHRQGQAGPLDNLGMIAVGSIVIAGLTISIGSIAPALGEGRAVAQALSSIAQQPDSSNTITRTLFVGLAMIESTAIYCFVVSMILLFANPFWNHFTQ